MCTVSITVQYMIDNVPVDQWTRSRFGTLERALALLNLLDKDLKQPDCLAEDKQTYLDDIRQFLYP